MKEVDHDLWTHPDTSSNGWLGTMRNGPCAHFVKQKFKWQKKKRKKTLGLQVATYVEDIICIKYINMFLR